jgi:tungstate transport system substrate-binding protein
LKFILPAFEKEHKVKVKVISVGTGKALELGKNGDVDVVLVHARQAEDRFIEEGHGVDRHDVMYNDFVLVGPKNDKLQLKKESNVVGAFKKIVQGQVRFISRGDGSGTDLMEQSYWQRTGQKPQPPLYVSAGLGMGEVLMMAAQMQAYTLSDRATFISYQRKTELDIVYSGDPKMFNTYGVIAVNPAKNKEINYLGARQLIKWLTSDVGQRKITEFKLNGEQVFFVNKKL